MRIELSSAPVSTAKKTRPSFTITRAMSGVADFSTTFMNSSGPNSNRCCSSGIVPAQAAPNCNSLHHSVALLMKSSSLTWRYRGVVLIFATSCQHVSINTAAFRTFSMCPGRPYSPGRHRPASDTTRRNCQVMPSYCQLASGWVSLTTREYASEPATPGRLRLGVTVAP
jgi:hypothetical protein